MASKPKTNWVKKLKADNGVSSRKSSGPKMGKAGNSNKLQKLVDTGADSVMLLVLR
jgi:hypothetical protein